MKGFSESIKTFIEQVPWTFAKTYAHTWPHEYIVEEQVDGELFEKMAYHIDTYGYKEYFYTKKMTYFDYGKHTYWHMENIINRCLREETFARRKAENRLP